MIQIYLHLLCWLEKLTLFRKKIIKKNQVKQDCFQVLEETVFTGLLHYAYFGGEEESKQAYTHTKAVAITSQGCF